MVIGIIVAALSCRPIHRATLTCMVWLIVTYLPASQALFPVGFLVAERTLYLPSVGAAILTSIILRAALILTPTRTLTLVAGGGRMRGASGTARVRARVGTWTGLGVCSCIIVALSVRTLVRNTAWRDGLSLRYV